VQVKPIKVLEEAHKGHLNALNSITSKLMSFKMARKAERHDYTGGSQATFR